MMSAATQEIKRKALQLGYVSCGVIPSSTFDEYIRYLDERIRQFPESETLYKYLYDSARPPENGKSIIVGIRKYTQYKVPDSLNGLIGKVFLFDGRIPYSCEGRAKSEFEAYLAMLGMNILTCDIPARWAAAKAGLGKFGRNNFIYTPDYGSYIWIDAWVVDKELAYDDVQTDTFLRECSEHCQKCIKACPTKALTADFSMDRGQCVAQLSYYAKDILEEDTRAQMGANLYGCDICQDVCPLNKNKMTETEDFPLLSDLEEYLQPENLLKMDEETYINVINPRFWYAGTDGAWLWKCNALRYMINSKDGKYHHLIQECCGHADQRLAKIAKLGCEKLGIDRK